MLGVYVSNTHIYNTYLAGLAISDPDLLKRYSKIMLATAKKLENCLRKLGMKVVATPEDALRTHHLWITFPNKYKAYAAYKALEGCRLHVNYRLLPYDLGHGLRLGTSWAAMAGLKEAHCDEIARIIHEAVENGPSVPLRHAVRAVRQSMQPLSTSVDY